MESVRAKSFKLTEAPSRGMWAFSKIIQTFQMVLLMAHSLYILYTAVLEIVSNPRHWVIYLFFRLLKMKKKNQGLVLLFVCLGTPWTVDSPLMALMGEEEKPRAVLLCKTRKHVQFHSLVETGENVLLAALLIRTFGHFKSHFLVSVFSLVSHTEGLES